MLRERKVLFDERGKEGAIGLHTAVVIACVASGAVLSFAWYLQTSQYCTAAPSIAAQFALTNGKPLCFCFDSKFTKMKLIGKAKERP